MTPEEVALVPTDDLVDALRRRFDHIIVAWCMDETESHIRSSHYWHGNAFACVGLAVELKKGILATLKRDRENGEPHV